MLRMAGKCSTIVPMNDSIFNFAPAPFASLRVTYMDGTRETFKEVAYQSKTDEPNPVRVDGSTVSIETREGRIITLLCVRRFEFL